MGDKDEAIRYFLTCLDIAKKHGLEIEFLYEVFKDKTSNKLISDSFEGLYEWDL